MAYSENLHMSILQFRAEHCSMVQESFSQKADGFLKVARQVHYGIDSLSMTTMHIFRE